MTYSATTTERTFRFIVLGAVVCAGFRSCSGIYVESPWKEPPKYCTAFLHFPKSGGSTIKNQLIEKSREDRSRPPGLITGVRRSTPEKRLEIVHTSTVIMGYVEMLRLPLEDYNRGCEYFTMLREPIDRLVSAFYFCPDDKVIKDNRPEKWCGDAVGQTAPIEERLMEFAHDLWGNSAFHMLMHSFWCDPRFELCKPELMRDPRTWPRNIDTLEGWQIMDSVKDLLSTYTAVGILEEWDLSMQLFNVKVTSPVHDWLSAPASNKATLSDERQALLDWAHASPQLHAALAADLYLYEEAVAVFRHQTAEALGTKWD
eukprot:jgi/Undpi1/379/HiC_scaffold_1.g00375.m1